MTTGSRFSLSTVSILFFLFFQRCLLGVTAKCHVDDETGLLGFKSGITEDPSGMLANWTSGTDCCTWPGISCRVNKRVSELSLYGSSDSNGYLSGTISSSLSKLRFLEGLFLENLRNITGSFPKLIFDLPDIKFVYLENNKLSGRLPVNIGRLSKLGALNLAGNRFFGPIPSSITELTQLTQLDLGGNLLTGAIPVEIRRFKILMILSLERNRLSGKIPDFFSNFSMLTELKLSYNSFSGRIPTSIAALAAKLEILELGHNRLGGKIPDFLGKFRALNTLDLSSNRLSGVVPNSFKNLTTITNLDLSHNNLIDPFPELNVNRTEYLDLSYNHFHLGEIPKWVTLSPITYTLKLAKCGIKLKIDDWKSSNLYFYDYIDLSENEISGSLIGFFNQTGLLKVFLASGNKLRFNMENLSISKSLKHLDLSRNLIFGKIPRAITGLEKMNVSHNHLCGHIPATKFPVSAFQGNDCLCGSPLPPCRA